MTTVRSKYALRKPPAGSVASQGNDAAKRDNAATGKGEAQTRERDMLSTGRQDVPQIEEAQ